MRMCIDTGHGQVFFLRKDNNIYLKSGTRFRIYRTILLFMDFVPGFESNWPLLSYLEGKKRKKGEDFQTNCTNFFSTGAVGSTEYGSANNRWIDDVICVYRDGRTISNIDLLFYPKISSLHTVKDIRQAHNIEKLLRAGSLEPITQEQRNGAILKEQVQYIELDLP